MFVAPRGPSRSTPARLSVVATTLLGLACVFGPALPVGLGAQRRPVPPPKPVPKAPAGPKFSIRISSDEEDPARRTVFVVYADGDGDVVWGSDKSTRSIIRLPVSEARALGVRLSTFGQQGIATACGTAEGTKRPATVVFRQVRAGIPRALALSCAIEGVERELVFAFADSVAETSGTAEPVAPWTVSCPVFTEWADSLLAVLPDSTAVPTLSGTCPRVYTAADVDQLAKRLLGAAGDSAATVLGNLGPRILKPVAPILADIDPGARARAARLFDKVSQQPFGEVADPNDFVVLLAQRWREETDRGVADTIGRALNNVVERNPGRIRAIDTIVQVLKARLPSLADRSKALVPADVDKDAPDALPLRRALDLAVGLKDAAGPLVSTISGIVGKSGSAADYLVAKAVVRLGPLAAAAGDAMRSLVIQPTPQRPGSRTVSSYQEGQQVAIEAARALAATGASGRRDLDSLWSAHMAPPAPDSADLPMARLLLAVAPPTPAAPKADSAAGPVPAAVPGDPAAKKDSVAPAPPPPDTTALRAKYVKARLDRLWGTTAGRSAFLDGEIRRQALVAGFGIACQADSAVTGPLGLVASEPYRFTVEAPAEDAAAQVVRNRLVGERERTRIAALDALGDCGTRAMAQLPVIAKLANAGDDPNVPDAVRRAAARAIPRVRRIE